MKTLRSQLILIVLGLFVLFVGYNILFSGLAFMSWFLFRFLWRAVVWAIIGAVLLKVSKRVAVLYFMVSFAVLGVYLLWIVVQSFFFWSKVLVMLGFCVLLFYGAWVLFEHLKNSGHRT